MTDQELYDRVKAHLLRQGEKSLGVHAQSAYFGVNGNKCAIGCLIPGEMYSRTFEGISIFSLGTAAPIRDAAGISDEQRSLARRLQSVHDSYGIAQWPQALRMAALEFGLIP